MGHHRYEMFEQACRYKEQIAQLWRPRDTINLQNSIISMAICHWALDLHS